MIKKEYDFKAIEKKWQKVWEDNNTFAAKNDYSLPKFYALIEFPYPSGEGLHLGHPRPYTALDIIARKRRMQGYNVLYPIGWDAFGLPAENYAIKNKVHPKTVTENNIKIFKAQCQSLGFSFDWTREVSTTDPAYYKWTQWIFIQMFKKGLAYKKEMNVNWCTSCKVVLANEEVVNGECERCSGEIIRKVKSQWMLKITEYAQRLIDDIDDVDYINPVKLSQKNWIGRSEGAIVDFTTTENDKLTIYTTRPDTLFGATYMVIAPEHPYINKWEDKITNFDAVDNYRKQAAKKSDFERAEIAKDKTGVRIEGVSAINPVTGKEIPVFISDYVLISYGTGAIMAVPGHDTRDYEFAAEFGLPIIEVVSGGDISKEAYTDCDTGIMVNSDFLDGLNVDDAKTKIIKWLEDNKKGYAKIEYKLRDWVFARQRYWGEPIPIVICDKCGFVPIPESELPLKLPNVESYEPTKDGESPLSNISDFVNTTCPKCGIPAKRETDTMPQWAGSSWYFLRYCDPENVNALAAKEALEYWMPVDWYNGGMEHTTLHLLYSRFWHKFLYDIGVVKSKEPYLKRTSHGMIMGENGEKMSKSRGNAVNPNDVIAQMGADTLRLYEMFVGDFEKSASWSTTSIKGCKRFLDRVFNLHAMCIEEETYRENMESSMHRTIKKVSEDIDVLKFNTAIAAMMTLVNEIYEKGSVTRGEYKSLLMLLNPFAPHVTEELWEIMGFDKIDFSGNCAVQGRRPPLYEDTARKDNDAMCSFRKSLMICEQKWLEYESEKCIENEVEIAVQICGKVKSRMKISTEETQENVLETALKDEKIIPFTQGKQIRKVIYVKGKLLNIVV